MARLTTPPHLLTTTLGKAMRWAQTQSMWPATFGLACCAIEMMATGTWRGSGWRCSGLLPARPT